MATYVKFSLEDGTEVYVETAETPRGPSGLLPNRGAQEAAEQAGHSFEQAVESVRKMAGAMIEKFHTGLEEPLSEVSISFGLKASGELGKLVVSRTGMESNYNVSLRWHKEGKEEKEESGEKTKEKKD